jgi:DNA invertase Pin-like site-specific DNA recombinase
MTIAIYERVSSRGQKLDSQHHDLQTWASGQESSGQVVKWYTDKFTGKTLDRPGMTRLLADIRAGKVKTVVVWRLDRLGRTAKGLTALFDELVVLKVNFVSLKDGIDLSTPAGRLIANVLVVIGIGKGNGIGIRKGNNRSTTLACGIDPAARGKGCLRWTTTPTSVSCAATG